MGLLDLIRPKKEDVRATRSALEAAEDGTADDGAINGLVTKILNFGLDGAGPLDSAVQIAEEARSKHKSTNDAIDAVVRKHLIGGAVGGFATGVGGFVTMPVAIPVNVLEFYVQATRMVGAIAHLRGYDVTRPEIRTAILLTLIGSKADDVLKKAGVATGAGRLTTLALKNLPPSAMLMINKAVGFRLLRGVGEKLFSRFGRGVPVLGGVVGGGIDGFMMRKIAEAARKEFPVKPA
ncbi:MAG: EcsC family protein [Nocardioides sp.]|jgi:hypothetical protein